MTDTKLTKLEKGLEALTTRYQAKTVQLTDTKKSLAATAESMATETDNSKWEALASQYGLIGTKISALIGELAVLDDKIRIERLTINDYEQSVVATEISDLITEQTGLRLKVNELQTDFRKLISVRTADPETRQKVIDVKTELSQTTLAGELVSRQLDAAKRKRDQVNEIRLAIA